MKKFNAKKVTLFREDNYVGIFETNPVKKYKELFNDDAKNFLKFFIVDPFIKIDEENCEIELSAYNKIVINKKAENFVGMDVNISGDMCYVHDTLKILPVKIECLVYYFLKINSKIDTFKEFDGKFLLLYGRLEGYN